MDNWPRIPRQPTASAQTRGGSSLPPPGSVIMASVEEDLGNGMYALRWNNNRISVSSQAVLSTGQSLILKSELSPEGRTTLVVQGPALPDAEALVSGGMIYSPKNRRADAGERQGMVHDAGRESPGASRTRPGSQSAEPDVAAGVARARPPAASYQPMRSLLGLVLEPLEDFPASSGRLLEAAREELSASAKTPSVTTEQGRIESAAGEHPTPEKPKAADAPGEPSRTRETRPPANAPGLPEEKTPPPAQSRPAASTEQTPAPAPARNGQNQSAAGTPGQPSPPLPAAGAARPRPKPLPASGQDNISRVPAESIPSGDNSVESPQSAPARNGQDQPAAGITGQPSPPPAVGAARPQPEPLPASAQDSISRIPAKSIPSGGDSAEPSPTPTPARNEQNQPAAGTSEQSSPPPPDTGPARPQPEPLPASAQDSVSRIPAESIPSGGDSAEPSPPPAPARNGQNQPAAGTPEQSSPPPAAGAAQPRPEPPPTHPAPRGQPAPDDIPGGVRRDVYVKEALTQMVRTAELPLASPSADGAALGMGGKMPEAVADKAAEILLRAAGLTPDPETLEAAKALLNNSVQVDRQTIQALMALAAAAGESDREAVMKAAARLSAKDIPLAAPLAGGLADVMERKAGVHELVERIAGLLDADPGVPQAKPLLDTAKQLLDMLHVDLDRSDAAIALERYVSTFGRETLGKALALVEKATQAVLENHPALPRIDKSLNSMLALLENSMVQAAQAETAMGPQAPGNREGESAPRPASPGLPPPQAPESGTPVPGRAASAPDQPTGAPRQPTPVPPGPGIATPQENPGAQIHPAGAGAGPTSPSTGLTLLPEAEQSRLPQGETARETADPLSRPQPAEEGMTAHPAPPPGRAAAINAYMNAPRAFNIQDLRHLPPMPKVASIPQAPPSIPAHLPGAGQPAITDGHTPAVPSDGAGPVAAHPSETSQAPAQTGEPAPSNTPPALTRPVSAPPFSLPTATPDGQPTPRTMEDVTTEAVTPKSSPVTPDAPTPPTQARPNPAPASTLPAAIPDGPPPPQTMEEGTTETAMPKSPPITSDAQTPPSPARPVPAPASSLPTTTPDGQPPDRMTTEAATPKLPPAASDAQTSPPRTRPVPEPASPLPAASPDGQPSPRPPAEPHASVLMKLDTLFQIPGLNRPEIELLNPSGFLQRYLDSGASDGPDGDKVKAEAGSLIRGLLSDDPERAERTLGELPRREENVLREAASRLSRMEQEIIRSDTVLGRLSDAATSLRDLGRQLLAVKAENLAGQDRDPGVMLAEVPFKLNDNNGDGRMQMFYRKSRGKRDGWTSRVILDLNTTGMGPVLGDLRFSNNDMTVNIFVEKQEAADFLSKSSANLVGALEDKGFRVKARFMVMPPPPQIQASRPSIGGEAASDIYEGDTLSLKPAAAARKKGRLDIRG